MQVGPPATDQPSDDAAPADILVAASKVSKVSQDKHPGQGLWIFLIRTNNDIMGSLLYTRRLTNTIQSSKIV